MFELTDKTNTDMDQLLREVKVWAKLKNKYIVQYKTMWFEYIQTSISISNGSSNSIIFDSLNNIPPVFPPINIQMEFCEMTLKEVLNLINLELNQNENQNLNLLGLHIRCQLFLEIVRGVNYLHSQKPPIIHRDLKLINVLFHNGSNGNFLKICDFGLAVEHRKQEGHSSMLHTEGVGTLEYIAPEVYSGKYNEISDMFSLGILMRKMFNIDRIR